jgi:hypothetical protein
MLQRDPNVVQKKRSIRPVDCHKSLHLQGEVFQLKYLTQQADALPDGIDDLIVATERLAPIRIKQPYVLVREAAGSRRTKRPDGNGPSGRSGARAAAGSSCRECAAASSRTR